jgi:hypothetical protein
VGISRETLLADVETFANENNLGEILPLLRKGALVAQTPGGYDDMPELDDEEKAALRLEQEKRWSHTRTLYLTIILNSIAAAIQGWDQTGELGACHRRWPPTDRVCRLQWRESVLPIGTRHQ